jgi:hypothetical protein
MLCLGYAIRFRFEAKRNETEAKFFLLQSKTEGCISFFRLEVEQWISFAKRKGEGKRSEKSEAKRVKRSTSKENKAK